MQKQVFLRRLSLAMLAGMLLGLAACNTVAGFGQDVQDSARTVQHAL